ncbi:hypothetical protein ABZ639_00835 [Saccharomonospora sp. NPDC006951]
MNLNFRFLDAPVAPVEPAYRLRITTGTPPPEAVAQWNTTSSWAQARTLYLILAA